MLHEENDDSYEIELTGTLGHFPDQLLVFTDSTIVDCLKDLKLKYNALQDESLSDDNLRDAKRILNIFDLGRRRISLDRIIEALLIRHDFFEYHTVKTNKELHKLGLEYRPGLKKIVKLKGKNNGKN